MPSKSKRLVLNQETLWRLTGALTDGPLPLTGQTSVYQCTATDCMVTCFPPDCNPGTDG